MEDLPWNYFKKGKRVGTCSFEGCNKAIKAEGGSTSGLHCYLKSVHKIDLPKRKKERKSKAAKTLPDEITVNKKKWKDYALF